MIRQQYYTFTEIVREEGDKILLGEELITQGCVVVTSHRGRKAYVKSEEYIAVECTGCSRIVSIEHFSRKKGRFAGVQSICKACEDNYRKENPEQIIKWREENVEHIREKDRLYREKNKERLREYGLKYYKENKERVIKVNRKYREKNAERYRENVRKYRKKNPHKRKVSDQRRFARKQSLPDNLTTTEYEETCAFFQHTCALSEATEDLHADHVIPLSVGHGGTTRGNMIPLFSKLNISKSSSNIFEWFEANRQRFELSQDKFDRLIGFLAEANDMSVDEYRKYVYRCHENPVEIDEKEAIE